MFCLVRNKVTDVFLSIWTMKFTRGKFIGKYRKLDSLYIVTIRFSWSWFFILHPSKFCRACYPLVPRFACSEWIQISNNRPVIVKALWANLARYSFSYNNWHYVFALMVVVRINGENMKYYLVMCKWKASLNNLKSH